MRAHQINEKFEQESDPVKDMGIGAKPAEILNLFCREFYKEFGIMAYPNEAGADWGLNYKDIYRIGDESFDDMKHPVIKLLTSPKHELLMAMNDKAAKEIVSDLEITSKMTKDVSWGWFYYVGGRPIYLKNIYNLKDVFKEIMGLKGITDKSLDQSIKRYERYSIAIKKLREFHE